MILVAATARGLSMSDIRQMQLGEVVDYCIEWYKMHEPPETGAGKKKPKKRKATQADWDAFLG